MTAAGSCFGRHVVSSVPLLFTRDPLDSRSAGHLRIEAGDSLGPRPDDELLIRWEEASNNPLEVAVYRSRDEPDRHLVTYGPYGDYVVRAQAGTIVVPAGSERVRREARLWAVPVMLCLIAGGDLPVHAAAFEIDGRAVIVGGLTRAGKSTMAAAAVRAGWRLLSEDTTALRLGSRCVVLPGAAGLRLRPDVAPWLELDDARRWTMDDGRVQLSLPRDGRGDSSPVPLHATVLLAWGEQAPYLAQVPAAEALRDLWSLTFRIPQTEDRVRCFDQLATLTASVPTYRLHRPRDITQLDASLDLLAVLSAGA